jgi:hypothetical protein
MSKEEEYKPKLGFDIRVKPPGKKKKPEEINHTCAWKDCDAKAPFKAPKSKDNPRDFQFFCQAHIRQFNAKWNFFEGMSATDAKQYRESTATGHRPTWKVSPNGTPRARQAAMKGKASSGHNIEDPFDMFEGATAAPREPKRKLPKQIRDAFSVMKLDPPSTPDEVKAKYKELVKKFHPDANQGEKGYEERLKRIIDAYQSLKSAGFCG